MIDEAARALLEPATRAALSAAPRWDTTSITSLRASLPPSAPSPSDPGVERREAVADGNPLVRVRLYRPRGATGDLPALMWLHGGGYVMGSLEANDARLEKISSDGNCVVLSVDWRLAPEHPYPAGLIDAHAVWTWMHSNAEDLGIETTRVIVGGASAGGGLAASLCHLLRDNGESQPILQWLIYPMLDDRPTDSMSAITDERLWNADANRLAWAAYLDGCASVPATAAPARAQNLRHLAPAFIAVGQVDGFVDENLTYAARLMRAGVPTELHVYPAVAHGGFNAAPRTERTRQFNDDALAALRRAFATIATTS